ncbi:MAG: hypothetical protein CMK59_14760 [Proteobacteria bacterium]|nr:hypothetical protein [Pseudomonadota bacterium]
MLFSILLMSQANAGEDMKVRPLFVPMFGSFSYRVSDEYSADTSQATYRGMRVGAAAGVKYKSKQKGLARALPNLMGKTRVLGTYTLGSEAVITDVHVGTFIGPKFGPLKLEIGADGIWTQTQISGLPTKATDPYMSFAIPARAIFDIKVAKLELSAAPMYFLGGERAKVDWTNQAVKGIGHEMQYGISARAGLGPIGVGLSYGFRVTEYGTDGLIGIGVGL